MNLEKCKCLNLPIDYSNFYSENFVGIDETNGRFGEVTIQQCKSCNSFWIRYFVEYESFSKSGRWFTGIIKKENDIKEITPENSVEYIESLDWYFYGGSYFRTTGKKGNGRFPVDL